MRSPGETISALRPHLLSLGITRLARQTGLDSIGIPCFAAIRPNSKTLAVNQGKGVDDDAAMASALMEAAEYATAEAPDVPVIEATASQLRAAGRRPFEVAHWLPQGQGVPDDLSVAWIEGVDLFSGHPVFAPRDALVIGGAVDLPAISQSTNGLASGNNAAESAFHALCELIERDATTLWVFKPDEAAAATKIAAASFDDSLVDDLVRRVELAGFRLTLFDQTTDIGVPVVFALIAPRDHPPTRHFDLAAGCGCHPIAARAAIRAITEAAQTRISNIAGARDDFDPAEYHQRLSASLQSLAGLHADLPRPPPRGLAFGTPLTDLMAFAKAGLAGAGIFDIGTFPLGGGAAGISVTKVLANGLEDRSTNRNWRPGARATLAMLGLK